MRDAPKATSLSAEEIKEALRDLPGWAFVDNKLHKEFRFKNFSEAFGFMTRVAIEAEIMNHHPEWHNTYNVVIIALYRHSNDDVTDLDVMLALKIESLLI